jgi:saccharopine dehydrogenase-like NADP-dependent oxidoreductase
VRVAVLGAAGTIAPAILRDLACSTEVTGLRALDRDGGRAAEAVARHAPGRARAAAVDALDVEALAAALHDSDVLVNAASYRVNLAAMEACLRAGVHYIDLGGLYHVTARQLERHEAFAAAGLLALLGAGAGPGKTNVMAARAARELDEVHAVRCASAGLDLDAPPGLSLPYALETLLDEMTLAPMVLRDGEPVALAPLADGQAIAFPEPVGERGSLYTLHSEVLTLGASLGARDVDFRLSLAPAVEKALRALADGDGAGTARPVPPSAQTYSAQHVEVSGLRDGAPRHVVVTALTVPHAGWGIGGGILSTGSVAAAAVRLLAGGALSARGALAPERVLAPDALFAQLAPRGCTVQVRIETPTPSEVS